MEEVVKFWTLIEQKLKGQSSSSVFIGTVVQVDESERTCTLKVGGVEYEDVRLYSVVNPDLKGFCLIPKKDSMVLAGRIENSNELFVLQFSEIDRILFTIADKVEFVADEKELVYKNDKVKFTISSEIAECISDKVTLLVKDNKISITGADEIDLNGTSNEGLVKVKEIVNNINVIEQDINDLKTILAAWIVVPNDGGAALKGAVANWFGSLLKKTIQKDLENTKVKH